MVFFRVFYLSRFLATLINCTRRELKCIRLLKLFIKLFYLSQSFHIRLKQRFRNFQGYGTLNKSHLFYETPHQMKTNERLIQNIMLILYCSSFGSIIINVFLVTLINYTYRELKINRLLTLFIRLFIYLQVFIIV